ncbi:DUF417 domain-containing protein [Mucilaginibacter psychrotolerans]|uniref:DUF417 domain-containing protein n=2 Tax=Mucilaginibacter psychrotolerans TaxID=1524096 RepID=A0A4Y8SAB3_9SPHI|nr:DUF417 domain-containing protein [Mucilaginibacter psychrotolerans]
MNSLFKSIISLCARAEGFGLHFTRFAIALVLIWIGALKFADYEADGIVPFVANSPAMSFFYHSPDSYKKHMNKEGELIQNNREWHTDNGTYAFAHGLGILLVGMGLLLLIDYITPYAGLAAGLLLIIMCIGTLSFLITTPECWVPKLGDTDFGFPYLSARGRLVIKDIIMLGANIYMIADSARRIQKTMNRTGGSGL